MFDSGYGGLTILRQLQKVLPQADFIYLGDNARAPYGNRSFDTVYRLTLEAVKALFGLGCHLVILACNTASAKALRSIQQKDLAGIDPDRRVLGVIRPTAEAVANSTSTGHVALVGTAGTVSSGTYGVEISHLAPEIKLYSKACPMWVPIVENLEINTPGADYFVERDIKRLLVESKDIDTLVLGCTHYPLLMDCIRKVVPENVNILNQGKIVAASLQDYLERHPEMDAKITRGGNTTYFTTEDTAKFDSYAKIFLGHGVKSSNLFYH